MCQVKRTYELITLLFVLVDLSDPRLSHIFVDCRKNKISYHNSVML